MKNKKEKPFVEYEIQGFRPVYSITFYIDSAEEVGRLTWDGGIFDFTGNVNESARLFFEWLKPYVDEYIKSKLEGK